jgi:hypothetical protein
MASTYEMIKALPGKSNWAAIHSALRAMNGGNFYDSAEALASSKGIRNAREAAMWMACDLVRRASTKSSFIPPSSETLSWGGFLGGTSCVWTDNEIEETTTLAVIAAIRRVA